MGCGWGPLLVVAACSQAFVFNSDVGLGLYLISLWALWCMLFDCHLNRLEGVRDTCTYSILFSVMLLIFKNQKNKIDATSMPLFPCGACDAWGHLLDVHAGLARPQTWLRAQKQWWQKHENVMGSEFAFWKIKLFLGSWLKSWKRNGDFPFESLTSDWTGAARARWVGRNLNPGRLRAEGSG